MKSSVHFYDHSKDVDNFKKDVLTGLTAIPKRIAPKYFYDEEGSRLFEAICKTPEYYVTRTEEKILSDAAEQIAAHIGQNCLLIDLGSGNSKKVRLLLETVRPRAYVPLDISKEFLLSSARALAKDYPWLDVHAACADFTDGFHVPYCPPNTRKIVFFPGSSIGNFEPEAAFMLLRRIASVVGPGGGLLIGVDLVKDPAILNAAYNDAAGYTAAFNRNLLNRINRELRANFDVSQFNHRAFFNATLQRIEMHLESTAPQFAYVDDRPVTFRAGETLHTENSYKYTADGFARLAKRAGFRWGTVWTDPDELFSVHFFVAA